MIIPVVKFLHPIYKQPVSFHCSAIFFFLTSKTITKFMDLKILYLTSYASNI